VARPVLAFVLLGVLAFALVAFSGLIVVRRLADRQALSDARELTVLSGGIVAGRVDDGLLTGDAESLGAVARVISDSILHDPVVRVKVWSGDGEILYSDETRLIGTRYHLDSEELDVLTDGGVIAEVSDLQSPENRYERSFGELMEVYTRITTPDGVPLLFETYQLRASIAGASREIASTFTPVLVGTLVALALLEIPLAWLLSRRVRRTQAEREHLMHRAIDSSDRERRRLAGDLHDGPVQELAGLSMRLSAAAEQVDDPSARDVLHESASAVRGSVRTLRSTIVGVYPPNVGRAGLPAALADLAAGLRAAGIDVNLDVAPDLGAGLEAQELLYRVGQESLRNVEEHAGAHVVSVSVRRDRDLAVMEVVDDGRGMRPAAGAGEPSPGEQVGLAILGDLIRDAGGRLTVGPGPGGEGTNVRAEVPAS
jgi:signal transduction histidine kinase